MLKFSCSEVVERVCKKCAVVSVYICVLMSIVQKNTIYTSLVNLVSTAFNQLFLGLFNLLGNYLYTLSTRPIIKIINLNNLLLFNEGV